MTDAAFIRFEGIHKAFGAKQVLKGVRFTIQRGETMVVLGGSGSGKSVLLRHIIGLHRPDQVAAAAEDRECSIQDASLSYASAVLCLGLSHRFLRKPTFRSVE